MNTMFRFKQLTKEEFLIMETILKDVANRRELSSNIWFVASTAELKPEMRLENIIGQISKFTEHAVAIESGAEDRMSQLTVNEFFYMEDDVNDAPGTIRRYNEEFNTVLAIASNDNLTPEDRISKIENLTSPF